MSEHNAIKQFETRQAFWINEGHFGRTVYDKLSTDSELPMYFTQEQAAEIVGLSPAAMHQRRSRKMPPSYISVSRAVRYPRHELISWLADMFCDRRS